MSVFNIENTFDTIGPKVLIDRVTIETGRVKVDLAIQEDVELEDNPIINNKDYLKFLSVYVVCVDTDQERFSTNSIEFQKEVIRNIYKKQKKYSISDFKLSNLLFRLPEKEFKNYYLSHDFNLDDAKNLTVFAFSYFDTAAIITENGLKGLDGFVDDTFSYGPLAGLSVLKNDQVDAKNVSDFRIRRKVEELNLDLSFIENRLGLAIQRLGSQKSVEIKKNPALFSDLWTSRNLDNTYGFSFVLDLYEVLEQNSFFSGLVKRMIAERKIDDFFESREILKILDISVFRRRVQNLRSSAMPLSEISVDTRENEAPELLMDNKKKKIQANIFDGTEFGLPREKLVISFRDEEIVKEQTGTYQYILEITLLDKIHDHMSEIIQQLESFNNDIKDYNLESSKIGFDKENGNRLENTFGFISAHIEQKFDDIPLERVDGYYDVVSNRFTQQWVEDGAESYAMVLAAIDYYVETLSLLTDLQDNGFIKLGLSNMVAPQTGNPRGVLTLLKLYSDMISKLKTLVGISVNRTKDLGSSAEPRKAKPLAPRTSRIFKIKKEFANTVELSTRRGYAYDYLSPSDLGEEPDYSGLIKVSKSFYDNRAITETKQFFQLLNSSIALDIATGGPTGVIINPNDSLDQNWLSYLTPSAIKSHSNNFQTLNLAWNNNRYLDTELKVLFSNFKNIDEEPEKGYDFLLDKTFLLQNLEAIENLFTTLFGFSIPSKDLKLFDVFSGSTFRVADSETPKDPVNALDKANSAIKQKPVDQRLELLQLLLQMLNSQIKSRGFELLGRRITSVQDLNPINWQALDKVFPLLPNQIKALFLSFSLNQSSSIKRNYSTGPDPFLDQQSGAGFRLHYMNLARIEYLEGFKLSGETKTFLKSPKWKLLKNFNEINSEKILCRIVPQGNNKHYHLPIYNKYFVIDISLSAASAQELTNVTSAAAQAFGTNLEQQVSFVNLEQTSATPAQDEEPVTTFDDLSDVIY